jgi:hypothetical protein
MNLIYLLLIFAPHIISVIIYTYNYAVISSIYKRF